MDQEKEQITENDEHTKKQSKRFLAFYIIGLFSVALVLILLSYLTQIRAEKQLNSLSDQLNQQTTVAQGATQKMEVMQKTLEEQQKRLEEQTKLLEDVSNAVGNPAQEQLASVIAQYYDAGEALKSLRYIQALVEADQKDAAKESLQSFINLYGDRLSGQGENVVLTARDAEEFLRLKEELKIA